MKVTLTWGQLAEVEALIDAMRAAQSYGLGEIRRESGATIVWGDDQVTLQVPDEQNAS
jgi:hypothetical protein